MASRADGLSRARSGILAPRVLCDRGVFDKMEDLVKKVGDFAKDLADDITGFIDSLPSVGGLMEMAEDFVKDKILSKDGLCIAPYCPGIHINSGVEENLAEKSFKEEELEILASHHITPRAYCPRATSHSRGRPHACRANTSISHTVLATLVSRLVWSNVPGAHHIVRLLQDV
jgi:hypothetical protein